MNPNNIQQFQDEFVQQLKEVSPQLSEVIEKHGLAEMFEAKIIISPTKKFREACANENFRRINQNPIAFVCILNTATNQFECYQ